MGSARAPLAPLLARAERCQFEQSPCPQPLVRRWRRAARVAARRRRAQPDPGRVGLGSASAYRPGELVRVKDADAVQATLDERGRLRGLRFTDRQWSYCGSVRVVDRVVRRMLDDEDRMVSISRAVTLAGVTCDGADGIPGCGRACALIFKDEWLEPAPEGEEPPPRPHARHARVKPPQEILDTIGVDGRLDGIAPAPEMLRLGGRRIAVARKLEMTDQWPEAAEGLPPPRDEWYVLDGVRCGGGVLGRAGPCDRQCALIWHASWLELE